MVNDSTNHKRRRDFVKATGGAIAISLAGCTSSNGSDGADGPGGSDSSDGSGGSDKTEASTLKERAKEEGKVKIAATTTGLEDYDKQFEQETGISVNRVRNDSKPTATKVLQEHQSGQQSFDFVGMSNSSYMLQLADNDVFWTAQGPLKDATYWHQDSQVAETYLQLDLGWLYNTNNTDSPPTTWSELASGDYSVTLDTEEPELLIAFEDIWDEEEAKNMVRNLGEVATLKDSHLTAAKEIAQGSFQAGVLKYKYLYYDWGRDILAPLHGAGEVTMTHKGNPVPIIAVPTYAGIPADAPRPNAGQYYLQYMLENIIDYWQGNFGEVTYRTTFYSPKKGRELDEAYILGWDKAPEMVEKVETFQKLVGIK